MNKIKEAFDTKLNIVITPLLATAIIKFVNSYETIDKNALAFNSPYLGVHKCCFLSRDRENFFDMFQLSDNELKTWISSRYCERDMVFNVRLKEIDTYAKNLNKKFAENLATYGFTSKEIKRIVDEIPTVEKRFNVISDPFNLLITYLLHKTINASLPSQLKEETMIKTILLLQYKFFTSLVNHRFKYPADEAIARATFESLNNRFDIKIYGTWKKLMEARARQFIDKNGLHYNTIVNYNDDKKILYILSDIQSRIRNQINTVMEEFMKTKANHDAIGSYSHLGTDNEGQIKMLDGTEGLDLLISSVYNDVLSVPRLLDEQAIRLVAGIFGGLSPSKLRSVLISFSEYAVKQAKSGLSKKIIEENGRILFIGTEVLLQNLFQKTYRYCIFANVDLGKPVEIIKTTKDVYSSSRILDEGIISVRESIAKLMPEIQDSRREATVATLRIAFVVYMMLLSFKYLKS